MRNCFRTSLALGAILFILAGVLFILREYDAEQKRERLARWESEGFRDDSASIIEADHTASQIFVGSGIVSIITGVGLGICSKKGLNKMLKDL
jgi:predicted PurR-regulated permease PerM